MPNKNQKTSASSQSKKRLLDRRGFLVAAPAAGLAAGAAALAGTEDGPAQPADPDRHLEYSETPHIQAYYRRARF